ncbi:EamA family transporter [Arthrobacter sp. Y81]|uniref:EamA family transporter n=1 Tax=Arthrobacter sp. Y81 TaxID=2058897 RepID=UPI0035BE4F9B
MLWITAPWGLCFLAIRLGLQDALVLWFAALRALIAAAALLLLCLVRRRGLPRGRRTWALITLMGVTNVTVAFAAMFAGTAVMAIGAGADRSHALPTGPPDCLDAARARHWHRRLPVPSRGTATPGGSGRHRSGPDLPLACAPPTPPRNREEQRDQRL